MSKLQVILLTITLLVPGVASISRVGYERAGGSEACPDIVVIAALRDLPEDSRDARYICTVKSQERLLVAAVPVLVLTSTRILSRLRRSKQSRGGA